MDRFADYVLVREFPEGNHGRVFMAVTPPRLGVADPHVALKVLARVTSDEAFTRIATELRLFAAVTSPYLVAIYEAGDVEGRLYYAMEYFADGSLGIRRRDFGRAEVLRAVAHAARAAHALHEAGVVHADIKPNNVLLHPGGAKLADLGLAQEILPRQRGGGTPVGSVEYMDPQIVLGGSPDPASDVWALGATLYRSLTGHGLYGPIPDANLLSALRHVANTPPRLTPDLAPAEAELLRACLAPNRADRPTALEVAEHLEQAVPGDSPEAS